MGAVFPLYMAEWPDSLKGRTVYLVDCRFDDGDILIAQMANSNNAIEEIWKRVEDGTPIEIYP